MGVASARSSSISIWRRTCSIISFGSGPGCCLPARRVSELRLKTCSRKTTWPSRGARRAAPSKRKSRGVVAKKGAGPAFKLGGGGVEVL